MTKEKDKTVIVREYILNMIESETVKIGQRLPGSKRIAAEINISLGVVQRVMEGLILEGIIQTVSRGGSYVNPQWRDQVLQNNLRIFTNDLPWKNDLQNILTNELPGLRITNAFTRGIFEIMTTFSLQINHNEFIDLTALFDECFPDKFDFNLKAFEAFYIDGKLVGIPLIYSPRVMYYNKSVLQNAGCEFPSSGWKWQDFIDAVKKIKSTVPVENIVNWTTRLDLWLNVVFRAGGKLIDPHADNPIRLDNSRTIKGLKLWQELGQLLDKKQRKDYYDAFVNDRDCAFLIGHREYLAVLKLSGWDAWGCVPLPLVPGGEDRTVQATDLLCIRKNCNNLEYAKKLIKIVLSEKFQNILSQYSYGIPVRNSAAARSIDISDPNDSMFLTEGEKVEANYNINSPELYKLLSEGVNDILMEKGNMEPKLKRLAKATKVFYGIINKINI